MTEPEPVPAPPLAGELRDNFWLHLTVRCPACLETEELPPIATVPLLKMHDPGGGLLTVEMVDLPVVVHACQATEEDTPERTQVGQEH